MHKEPFVSDDHILQFFYLVQLSAFQDFSRTLMIQHNLLDNCTLDRLFQLLQIIIIFHQIRPNLIQISKALAYLSFSLSSSQTGKNIFLTRVLSLNLYYIQYFWELLQIQLIPISNRPLNTVSEKVLEKPDIQSTMCFSKMWAESIAKKNCSKYALFSVWTWVNGQKFSGAPTKKGNQIAKAKLFSYMQRQIQAISYSVNIKLSAWREKKIVQLSE